MSAEVEETLVHPDLIQAQRVSEQVAQGFLGRVTRKPETFLLVTRRGQRPPVQLPVHRHRHRIQHHQRRRHHVIRQHPGQVRTHLPRIKPARIPARHHIPHQPPISGTVLPHHHRRLAHRPVPDQRRLHLTRLDPEPPHLHLLIGPPQELQDPPARLPFPLHCPPHQISRPVHECDSTRPQPRPATRSSATSSATPRCVTATPFGTPVDPDVNITYAS